MRIAYMSDLHLEFEPLRPSPPGWKELARMRANLPGHPDRGPLLKDLPGVDLVVLAGDIDLGCAGITYAGELAEFAGCPVVYVAGNHEYFGHDLDHLRLQLREAAGRSNGRVFFLERDSLRLWLRGHPLLVHGCTLWTDYALNGVPERDMALAEVEMSDHRRISRDFGWFSPIHAREEHRRSLDWLNETLSQEQTEERGLETARRLVVTHHAPVRCGVKSASTGLEAAYMSDLEELLHRVGPDVWLHGHTHHRHVTRVGRSLIASAPRGYPGREAGSESANFGFIEL